MEIKEEWKEILENLPDESNTLDYKVKFYDIKDDNGKKNKREIIEMCRDVNAFLNSPRESSAYILCGVSDDKKIIGLGEQFINTDLVFSCLEEYIELTAKINVENFVYDEKNFCIIEIDIPFQGHKSKFIKEYTYKDKQNPKNDISVPVNDFFFRRKDKNIISKRLSHADEIELSNWLRSQVRYEPEIENIIDEHLILLQESIVGTQVFLELNHNFESTEAKVRVNYRYEEIQKCKKELIIDETETSQKVNKDLLKKYRINNRLYIPLLEAVKNDREEKVIKKNDYSIFWVFTIPFIICFLIFFSVWFFNNKQEEKCSSSPCTSLRITSNLSDFRQNYKKAKCDCNDLLTQSFEKNIDSLIIGNHYLAARLFLIDNSYMVGINSFNHKLETVVNNDTTLSVEQKNEILEKYRRVQ